MKFGMYIVTPNSISTAYLTSPSHQETYLREAHFHETETTRNRSHHNELVSWTQVKTLHNQQTSHIKTTLTPIWTYGIHLWRTASTSNIEILERFESKALRMIVDAPWYIPNTVIRRDLQTPTVKGKIRRYSSQYGACLSAYPNNLEVPNYQYILVMMIPSCSRFAKM
jgi:hypothetical protein